jgi:hypothetical protein
MVSVLLLVAVGVPLITPALESVRPAGIVPLTSEKTIGAVPPLVWIVAL